MSDEVPARIKNHGFRVMHERGLRLSPKFKGGNRRGNGRRARVRKV